MSEWALADNRWTGDDADSDTILMGQWRKINLYSRHCRPPLQTLSEKPPFGETDHPRLALLPSQPPLPFLLEVNGADRQGWTVSVYNLNIVAIPLLIGRCLFILFSAKPKDIRGQRQRNYPASQVECYRQEKPCQQMSKLTRCSSDVSPAPSFCEVIGVLAFDPKTDRQILDLVTATEKTHYWSIRPFSVLVNHLVLTSFSRHLARFTSGQERHQKSICGVIALALTSNVLRLGAKQLRCIKCLTTQGINVQNGSNVLYAMANTAFNQFRVGFVSAGQPTTVSEAENIGGGWGVAAYA
ncbi:hypothetical protein B0H14DRAFT_3124610 [Mycena olivaceomarginata]|nr:hypothetical protein B0H14DRAFT_3124610 [Mycena olivaceomarginata]